MLFLLDNPVSSPKSIKKYESPNPARKQSVDRLTSQSPTLAKKSDSAKSPLVKQMTQSSSSGSLSTQTNTQSLKIPSKTKLGTTSTGRII